MLYIQIYQGRQFRGSRTEELVELPVPPSSPSSTQFHQFISSKPYQAYVYPSSSANATQLFYEGIFTCIQRLMEIDYYWIWARKVWMLILLLFAASYSSLPSFSSSVSQRGSGAG